MSLCVSWSVSINARTFLSRRKEVDKVILSRSNCVTSAALRWIKQRKAFHTLPQNSVKRYGFHSALGWRWRPVFRHDSRFPICPQTSLRKVDWNHFEPLGMMFYTLLCRLALELWRSRNLIQAPVLPIPTTSCSYIVPPATSCSLRREETDLQKNRCHGRCLGPNGINGIGPLNKYKS